MVFLDIGFTFVFALDYLVSFFFFGSFFFVCLISFKVAVDNFIARRIAFS